MALVFRKFGSSVQKGLPDLHRRRLSDSKEYTDGLRDRGLSLCQENVDCRGKSSRIGTKKLDLKSNCTTSTS